MRDILKRIEQLWLPKISDGVVLEDKLSGYEFDYSSITSVNIDTLPDVNNGKWFPFNQGKYTKTMQACTIVNSLRNLAKTANAVWGVTITNQDIFDCVDYAVTMGYTIGKGWMGTLGVDAARKWWNMKHPDMLINSYTIRYDDPDFPKLKLKGYGMSSAYNGSTLYNQDYQSDAVLDGASFGPRTYGHWTNMEKGPQVNDSYTGNFYNIYKVMQPDAIVRNGVRSEAYFFFAPAHNNADEIKRLQAVIADCNSQNTLANKLIGEVTDEKYKTIQNNLIIANNKKIEDAKLALNKL